MRLLKTVTTRLLRNKTYGVLNIAGLAIGITCAGLLFLWVGDELSFDHGNKSFDTIYSVLVNAKGGDYNFTMGSTPRPMAAAMKTDIPGVAAAARASDNGMRMLFTAAGKQLYATGLYADPDLFNIFTIPFTQGNAQHPFPQLYSIVLSESSAARFFGAGAYAIGRTVRLDNDQDYVVSGVVKDMPENSTLQFGWLAPYESLLARQRARYGWNDVGWNSGFGPVTYVALTPSADPAAIDKRLKTYLADKGVVQPPAAFLYPMRRWHLYQEFTNWKETGGGRIRQVRILTLVAWIILIIACINFMNLATARSERRAKEIGVRKVLGSGRGRLIRQFIGEAIALSTLATVLAVILMALVLPWFNLLMGKQLTLGLNDPAHLLALIVIALISGLLAGSYPSVYLSSFDPVPVLKGLRIKTGGATMIRQGLVVLQFSLSVIFIISTIVIYLQIQHVKTRNLGFDKDNLLEIDMQHDISGKFPAIRDALMQTGLVSHVAFADHATIEGGNTIDDFNWAGKPASEKPNIAFRDVSADFLATTGMHLAAGRNFSGTSADSSDVIVNQTFADLIDKKGVLGRMIQSHKNMSGTTYKDMRIVGVVNDYVYGNIYGSPGPVAFFSKVTTDDWCNLVYVRIREQRNSEHTLAAISEVIANHNPAYPFQYKFVDDQFNSLFAGEVRMSRISGIFAGLAILISCLGLFSLAAYTAERRIKEIGIRKVLGATVTGLAALLSKDFLKLIGLACLVAFPLAGWIMHGWLQNYEYRVGIHWWIFALAGATAMLVSILTVSFQALKAAIGNPIKALRSE